MGKYRKKLKRKKKYEEKMTTLHMKKYGMYKNAHKKKSKIRKKVEHIRWEQEALRKERIIVL